MTTIAPRQLPGPVTMRRTERPVVAVLTGDTGDAAVIRRALLTSELTTASVLPLIVTPANGFSVNARYHVAATTRRDTLAAHAAARWQVEAGDAAVVPPARLVVRRWSGQRPTLVSQVMSWAATRGAGVVVLPSAVPIARGEHAGLLTDGGTVLVRVLDPAPPQMAVTPASAGGFVPPVDVTHRRAVLAVLADGMADPAVARVAGAAARDHRARIVAVTPIAEPARPRRSLLRRSLPPRGDGPPPGAAILGRAIPQLERSGVPWRHEPLLLPTHRHTADETAIELARVATGNDAPVIVTSAGAPPGLDADRLRAALRAVAPNAPIEVVVADVPRSPAPR